MSTKPCTMSERMKQLLSTGIDADVHFLVGGENDDEKELLKAHKLILKSACDVFEAMFRFDAENDKTTDGVKAKSNEISRVVVTDIDADVFKAMLSYIYLDDSSGLNGDNAMAVLYAAEKYNIVGLVKACVEDFPISKLSNIFQTYVQANFLEEEDFAGRCLEYINENVGTLFQSEAFYKIDQTTLSTILALDQLMIDEEMLIWEAALRWADEQCRQKGNECTAENRRLALGPALYKIRFPLIEALKFTQIIVPSEVLTNAEVIGVYQYYCHSVDDVLPAKYPLLFDIGMRLKREAPPIHVATGRRRRRNRNSYYNAWPHY